MSFLVLSDFSMGQKARSAEPFEEKSLTPPFSENLRHAAGVDFGAKCSEKGRQRLRTQVALAVMAHRNSARFGFLTAHDCHIRNFLQFRVANLGLQLFVAVIERGGKARGAER